jgi:protein-disulfide isomerase
MRNKLFSTSALIIALLGVTAAMQARLLFLQFRPPRAAVAIKAAPDGSKLDIAGLPSLGDERARVVIVEFSDYECPFCRQYSTAVFPQLRSQFVDAGDVRYVFANNPLPMHPQAEMLATAALCAGEQGQYWQMHDSLFAKKPANSADVSGLAHSMALDTAAFDQCLRAAAFHSSIKRGTDAARQLGLTGTPGFALGTMESGAVVRIHTLIVGAQPLATFEQAINQLAKKSPPKSPQRGATTLNDVILRGRFTL